ncbi:MAG: hypothetical protein NXH75_17265, partial [Halobacteriovoraceae bacterium]|nr:hypothetical protein [Halobacteriovoraceae bacterium]
MKLLEELKHHFFEMADSFGGLKFTGGDVVRFLNGQLSNDVAQLEDGKFQLQARLDRGGRLKAHFYLLKASDQYLAVIPKDYLQELREDLEKYIIMDDVEVEDFQIDLKIILSPVEKL